MAKCRVCNGDSEHDLCSEKCISIIDDAKGRIMQQNSLFDILIDNAVKLKCKDCGGERKKFTQYCKPCAMRRDRERKREYEEKKRKPRFCANKECGKPLGKDVYNSQKYCSPKCKKDKYYNSERKKELRLLKKQSEIDRGVIPEVVDKYEGTVPSKWIQPRGSKKRKEMGLEVSKFGLGKDSDTGGRFVY